MLLDQIPMAALELVTAIVLYCHVRFHSCARKVCADSTKI